jgi:hypothetical protein
MDRVNAQQARRILDRLVGYKISPLLWAKVRGGLSAGRVQSVAVKLIVDREREIERFVPREYWTITALLEQAQRARPRRRSGRARRDRRRESRDRQRRARRSNRRRSRRCAIRGLAVKQRETRRNAAAPFTTSTLQQEASRKLKFRVRKTMQPAQALYEGVDLGSRGDPRSHHLHAHRFDAHLRRGAGRRQGVHRGDLRPALSRRRASSSSSRRRPGRARSDPPDLGRAHAGVARGRPQARRVAALRADLGALRRLADGGRGLRSDLGRHRREARSAETRLHLPRDRQRPEVSPASRPSTKRAKTTIRARKTPPRKGPKARVLLPPLEKGDALDKRRSNPNSTSPSRRRASPKPRS